MRETIVQVLLAVETKGAYPADVLAQATREMTPSAAGYVRRCVYGVLEEREALEAILREAVRSGVRVKREIRIILLAGIYQLLRFDTVKAHAVVDASVRIAKKRDARSAGFVNGVLRTIERRRDEWKQNMPDAMALPTHILRRLDDSFGEKERAALLRSLLDPAHLCVRINPLRATRETLSEAFADAGMALQPSTVSPTAFRVSRPVRVAESAMVTEGKCTIQDEAASLVVPWGNPRRDERWLDLCAAPGGKTTQLAECMEDTGRVVSCDVYPAKLERIREHVKRLRLGSVEIEQNDATSVREDWREQFDGVLVDAPCSGLGLLRRKPDIAYNRTEEDFSDLIALQRRILDSAATAVRPGGTLLYSTCTILREENEGQIHSFLKRNPAFRPDGDAFQQTTDMVKTGADGFYMARLVRLPL